MNSSSEVSEAVSDLLNSTVHGTPSSSKTTPAVTPAATDNDSSGDELNRYSPMILAEGHIKKMELIEHYRRLASLRKEADALEKTDWMYEPVEKLLGKLICEMPAMYSGADLFGSLLPNKIVNSAVRVKQDIVDIVFGLEIAIYRKSSTWNWFMVGFGSPETEIFSPELKISKVVVNSLGVTGFSKDNNLLYSTILKLDKNSEFYTVTTTRMLLPESMQNLKITDIASFEQSEEILVGTEEGCIYRIELNNSSESSLLFQLNCMRIEKIANGFDHVMILTDAGAIYSWGIGSRGQLGNGEVILNCENPKRVEFFDDLTCTVVDIVCGGWHCLALTSDGDIYSWGWNESGQLGTSTSNIPAVIAAPYPVDLGSGDNPVIAISAGSRHSAALLRNGGCFTWGWNKYGQLSVGDKQSRFIPTKVCLFESSISKVSCTRWGTCFMY